jgi:hypothetical protein
MIYVQYRCYREKQDSQLLKVVPPILEVVPFLNLQLNHLVDQLICHYGDANAFAKVEHPVLHANRIDLGVKQSIFNVKEVEDHKNSVQKEFLHEKPVCVRVPLVVYQMLNRLLLEEFDVLAVTQCLRYANWISALDFTDVYVMKLYFILLLIFFLVWAFLLAKLVLQKVEKTIVAVTALFFGLYCFEQFTWIFKFEVINLIVIWDDLGLLIRTELGLVCLDLREE